MGQALCFLFLSVATNEILRLFASEPAGKGYYLHADTIVFNAFKMYFLQNQ